VSLQSLLGGLRPGDLFSTSRSRSPENVEAVRGRLAALFDTVADLPEHEDLNALERRIRRALDEDQAAYLARRDWRMLPYALWHRDPPLVEHPGLLPALRMKLKDGGNARRLLRNLLSAYLRAFDPHLPRLAEIARLIDEHRFKMDEIWRMRVDGCQLTQPDKAPHAVFLACIRADRPPEALEEAGIDPDVHHGILRATLLAGTQAIERNFPAGRWNAKAMDFVEGQIFAEDALVDPELRRALADAYLRPWLNGDPSDGQLKARIQDFMLRRYGDPRTKPQRWTGVSEDARSVMQRWLVKVVLDQFLDVIDDVVQSAMHRRQWKYRREFWLAYFRKDAIIEADVLFGPHCHRRSRQLFGRDAPCAILEGDRNRPVFADHAVLLMRIGRLIIADWSHNACWCVWRDDDPGAPRFGRSHYLGSEVYRERGRWSRAHSSPTSYTWQDELRELINAETGIDLHRREYTVQ
jgi:hypothetical protein